MAKENSGTPSRGSNDAITEAIGDDGRIADVESGPNGNEGREIDPASIAGTAIGDDFARDENGNIKRNKDGTPQRKRGRKATGNGGGKSTAKSPPRNSEIVNGVNTLAQSLMIFHAGLASFTKFEQFALEEKEATALSTSIVNVMTEFDIAPDPKLVAVTGLVTTAGMIYGPRLYLYSEHRAAKKKEAREKAAVNHAVNPAPNNANSAAFDPASFFQTGNVIQ